MACILLWSHQMFMPGQFKSQHFDLTSPSVVSCMMMHSRSKSEDDLFLLTAVALVWTLHKKGKQTKQKIESQSLPFLFDLLGVSRLLSTLCWLAR